MALADRIDHGTASSRFVYCLMSDGELDEITDSPARLPAVANRCQHPPATRFQLTKPTIHKGYIFDGRQNAPGRLGPADRFQQVECRQ